MRASAPDANSMGGDGANSGRDSELLDDVFTIDGLNNAIFYQKMDISHITNTVRDAEISAFEIIDRIVKQAAHIIQENQVLVELPGYSREYLWKLVGQTFKGEFRQYDIDEEAEEPQGLDEDIEPVSLLIFSLF
jgi:hypothetical protein